MNAAGSARLMARAEHLFPGGVSLLPPSQHEAWFVSAAHRAEDLETTIRAAQRALASMRT